jgi:signal recognition particle subunit SRP54
MGSAQAPLAKRTDGRPTVILMCGLQGAGKTTAISKLAQWSLDQKFATKPLLVDHPNPNPNPNKLILTLTLILVSILTLTLTLTPNPNKPKVAADVYRPAAIEQLKTLGERVGVDVYSEGTGRVV